MPIQTTQTKITSDKARNMEQDALVEVNAITLNDINMIVKAYPSMDITEVLEQKLKTYPALRKAFRESALQSANSSVDIPNSPNLLPDVRRDYQISVNAKVIQPSGAAVVRAAQIHSLQDGVAIDLPTVLEQLNELVAFSEIIWHLGSTVILGFDSKLVIKVGQDIDISHISTVNYIKQQARELPIPDIHGILQQPDGSRTFLFMSRVSGEPLDSKWNLLDERLKVSIKDQLDVIFKNFRFISPPPTEDPHAVLGGGNPRRCKDARRELRVAEQPISNEAEFNDFICSNPQRTNTSYIAMIRSYLTTNHEIVMTHGDLHARNIMVSITSGEAKLTGADTSPQFPCPSSDTNTSSASRVVRRILGIRESS
ncbi:hypothetical protein PHISCL_05224 [Aspergillus sclerotialis]|uniref:Phosphotransferase enzyme family n=1 Tax=Aspergillus sclerotialis TaxID=2070753 RepID=A0A3A2ZM31_9EURO|nr:hypothetical protein PHISCL_05224 [Aspergillus sclerotialis]